MKIKQEVLSSDSSSDSYADYGKTNETDDEKFEKVRRLYEEECKDMEAQHAYLKEQLYQEKMAVINAKIEEVRAGKAKEYTRAVAKLKKNLNDRLEVAASLRQFRINYTTDKFDIEKHCAKQNYKNDIKMLPDLVKADIERKNRKEPVVVDGPYIVYRLRPEDISRDWTLVRELLAQKKKQEELKCRRKVKSLHYYLSSVQNTD